MLKYSLWKSKHFLDGMNHALTENQEEDMKEQDKKILEKNEIEKRLAELRRKMLDDLNKKRFLGMNTQIQRIKNHYDLMTRV